MDYTTNENNAEMLTVNTPPHPMPAAYTYDDGWIVTDQSLIDAYRSSITPQSITPRQCRLQLLAETLLDEVEAAIGAMPQAAQIEWEYALEIKRTYGLVTAMQALLGKDDVAMDTFFMEAARL